MEIHGEMAMTTTRNQMTTAVSKAKMYVTRKTATKTKETTAEETETIIQILEVSPPEPPEKLKPTKAKIKIKKGVAIREEEVHQTMGIGEVEEGEEEGEEVEEAEEAEEEEEEEDETGIAEVEVEEAETKEGEGEGEVEEDAEEVEGEEMCRGYNQTIPTRQWRLNKEGNPL